jgi:hypothetical protein
MNEAPGTMFDRAYALHRQGDVAAALADARQRAAATADGALRFMPHFHPRQMRRQRAIAYRQFCANTIAPFGLSIAAALPFGGITANLLR